MHSVFVTSFATTFEAVSCKVLRMFSQVSLAGAATSIKYHKYVFVATKQSFVTLRKKYACRDKIMWDVFCRDKHVFVATKVSLSRQNLCREKNKMFVATKLILVAVPANDTKGVNFVTVSVVSLKTKDCIYSQWTWFATGWRHSYASLFCWQWTLWLWACGKSRFANWYAILPRKAVFSIPSLR